MTNGDGNAGGGFGSSGGAGAAVAGAQLIGGLYNSYQDRKTSKENVNKTIAAQKAEAELAYQRSVEMWNMQNLYNSPEAQMARFKAAGLNPHLIYGQGNAGNSSNIPNYQPANLQYKYAAPSYGSSIQAVLPTLMQVGTWLQNMRLGEAELLQKRTNTERAQQMVDYLLEMNPKLLQEKENRLSLFPYQSDMQQTAMVAARQKLEDMRQDYRFKYGQELYDGLYTRSRSPEGPQTGMRQLQFVTQEAKSRLEQAKASWTDFGVTSPQALIQLVLGGVMGMAGQTLKATPKPRIFKGGSGSQAPKRIKTYYDKGKRRSQVVDFD